MRPTLMLLGAAALVSAQANSTCCGLTPNLIDINQRLGWCRAERNTCPELCTNGATSANTCDENTLTFSCVCSSGTTPNISDYGQTLPSLMCDEWKRQCIQAHPNDLAGQNFCLSFTCGSRNATAVGAGAGSTGGSPASGSASRSASTSTPSASSTPNAASMLAVGREYGTGVVLLTLSGFFAFAL